MRKHQSVHFGFSLDDKNNFYKLFRDTKGAELNGKKITLDKNDKNYWRGASILEIANFAKSLKDALSEHNVKFDQFSSAQLAMQLIECGEKVSYKKISNG